MRGLVLLLALTVGNAVAEPLKLGDLARAFAASRAMERGEATADATAPAYRAGRFDGYLVGLAEAMQARGEICLPGCFCHVRERLDPALEQALAEPALDLTQPATPWLAAQLRKTYPCPAR